MDLLESNVLYKDESYAIIGACFEVYNKLGNGFLEAVYQEALEIEFSLRGIPCRREVRFTIDYKGHILKKEYIADFVCYDKIIVEVKAVANLISEHSSQVLNYLNASEHRLGLLVNFGETSFRQKRIVL